MSNAKAESAIKWLEERTAEAKAWYESADEMLSYADSRQAYEVAQVDRKRTNYLMFRDTLELMKAAYGQEK